MIVKITRGDRMAGLMMYLLGPQREDREHKNVHTDEHVIAGHDAVMFGAPRGRASANQIFDIANALDMPRRVFGTRVTVPVKAWDEEQQKRVKVGDRDAHVWHASLSIKAGEGPLTDAMWASIAKDFVRGMGFVDDDGAKSARWVAVRHGVSAEGNDHVHIAVSLVCEDGSKARVNNDFKRAGQVVNELEHKYGLTVLESRESEMETPETAAAKGDLRRASQHGMAPERLELARRVRTAAGSSETEAAFVERLRELRVLVRPRYARGGRDRVEGYSVALYPETDRQTGEVRRPVWHAPSKLDSTLGLGALRRRWASTPEAENAALQAWQGRHGALREERFGLPPRMSLSTLTPEAVARLNAMTGEVIVPQAGRVDRAAAAQLAGAFAHASMYFERAQHGPMAKASDQLARLAQKPKYDRPRNAGSPANVEATGYQARLMQRALSSDSATGWLAVMRQMQRVSRAIADAQEKAGHASTATALNRHAQQALAAVEAATAQMPGTTPSAPTTTPTLPTGRPITPTTRRPDQGIGRD